MGPNSSKIVTMKRLIPVLLLCSAFSVFPAYSQESTYDVIEPGAAALLGTGIAFMETSALLLRPGVLIEQDRALSAYQDYLTSTSGGHGWFNDGTGANRQQVQSWVNFGTGMLFASSLFFFPEEKVTISLAGKFTLAGGLAVIMAGNVFDSLALSAFTRSKISAEAYETATSNAGDLYAEYQEAHNAYLFETAMSMILKGVGGAAVFASFLIPGKKEPYFPSTLHKIMNAGALFFFTAGVVTKSIAQVHLVRAPYAYFDYEDASSNTSVLYEEYKRLNTTYTALNLTSYGLWIAGGSALITALFLPPPSETRARLAGKQRESETASVSLVPVYNGNFGIGLSVSQ